MAIELIIAPEVKVDVSEAYQWYERQRFGLGEEFLSCLDASVQKICRSPEMYAKVYENYRRGMLRRFPYAVFYEYVGSRVYVYSVFHTSKNPKKWRERLP